MDFIRKITPGLLICLLIAIPAWFLGKILPVVGGAVIAILSGMLLTLFLKDKSRLEPGIRFVSKKILQYAVILLGFGLNFSVVLQIGRQSLPLILCTITTSLVLAFCLQKVMHVSKNICVLVGVGSSICGGSAIAATAPIIDASDEEVAQAISIIFFFNVIAAVLFPALGTWLSFPHASGEIFGLFAGTAINDTSSVTAAASTWDSMYHLGSATLDTAVTVKLTRTLAIIPITIGLAFLRARKEKTAANKKIKIRNIFPSFILFFLAASIFTTVSTSLGAPASIFHPLKELSKFFIILAMSAIGLNTNIIKLIKTGGKPILIGLCCWVGITTVSLLFIFL